MTNKIILFAVIALIPTVLAAQNRQMAKGWRAARGQKMILSILNDEQQKQWSDISIRHQKQRNEIEAKLKNTRLDLRQLMDSQRLPDETAVQKN
jgi:hypothetical protein